MQVVVSPLAPHRPGDQMQPVVQRFAFYCQGALVGEAPVDAEQAGGVLRPACQNRNTGFRMIDATMPDRGQ